MSNDTVEHNRRMNAPGTIEAANVGCCCPRVDNQVNLMADRWPAGPGWVIDLECSLHSGAAAVAMVERGLNPLSASATLRAAPDLPLGELIGWTVNPDADEYDGHALWCSPRAEPVPNDWPAGEPWVDLHDEPEVDDLIDWLRTDDRYVVLPSRLFPGDKWWVGVIEEASKRNIALGVGDTLLAACADAVRIVAAS